MLQFVDIILSPNVLTGDNPGYVGIIENEDLWWDRWTECKTSWKRASRVLYIHFYGKFGRISYHNSPAGQVGAADVVRNTEWTYLSVPCAAWVNRP